MTDVRRPTRVTREELEAEGAVALPAKEVISLLNLNVDLDLALDIAAPIDLAVAANLNVAAPIDAAVSANVLSFDSIAAAQSTQQVLIDQHLSGEAIATASQDSVLDQGDDPVDTADTADTAPTAELVGTVEDATEANLLEDPTALLDDGLLNVDVHANLDANIAAPIAGAVAINANVAAPIDASVAANIGSVGSEAVAVADQTAVITQNLEDVTASADADQSADITQ